MAPRWIGTPACSKPWISMPCPMATTMISAGMRTASSSAPCRAGAGPALSTSPMIWGWAHRAGQLSVLIGLDADGGVESQDLGTLRHGALDLLRQGGHVLLTAAVDAGDLVRPPGGWQLRVTSMATLPPPMTTTCLPVKSGISLSPMRAQHLHGGDDVLGCPRPRCPSFCPCGRRWRCTAQSYSFCSSSRSDIACRWSRRYVPRCPETGWSRSPASSFSRGKR